MRFLVMVACVCGLTIGLCGCERASQEPYVINGPVKVYFVLESGGGRSDDEPKPSSSIQFFDKYILVTDGRGGRFIPISQIIQFRWE